MKDLLTKNVIELRRQHNIDLIRKMRAGDSLTSFDAKASWYPPRPTIEKDSREIARLYHNGDGERRTHTLSAAAKTAQTKGLRVLDGQSPESKNENLEAEVPMGA